MTTDWKALCAKLVELDDTVPHNRPGWIQEWTDAITAARAALAEQEVEPTDEELNDTYWTAWHKYLDRTNSVLHSVGLRAVLARWGNPVPQPVPVSERLPGPEDCDAEGRCWWWHPSHAESGYSEGWMRRPRDWGVGHYDLDDRLTHTHWLSAHALPLPGQEVEG